MKHNLHELAARMRAARPVPVRSRGLGDTIAKLTKAVGLKRCGGCKKRQAALNRRFPYSSG